ncbi:hypothetical protein [Chromatocurvus halotolerans]|uniref:Sulfotransferase domain-containing protein n=1 Tax=Chromatocurvus halotolerans TaxID=1132028 RepID=A0A4R2KK05_9GAMM|nr:hypothetical protein [Chromatocurvus halotolerans]TCO74301.1 hypothetical protein EV688_11414 [Chromatocurvus halotolerans]
MALCYEELCKSPVETTKALFAFCDLPLTEATNEFLETSTTGTKGGYYSTQEDPLLAANRWRQELDSKTIEDITAVARRFASWRIVDQSPSPDSLFQDCAESTAGTG